MTQVSVIIPAYNCEAYLETAVNSVVAQTFSDWELIIINDGSKDNTLNIARNCSQKDKRITVIDQNNTGLPGAESAGINASKGEWIMFLDNDDWYEPEMIETLYRAVIKNAADCARLGYKKVFPDGKEERPLTIENEVLDKELIEKKILKPFYEETGDIYRHWSAPRWDKIFSASLLKEVFKTVDLSLTAGEDLVTNLKYLNLASKVVNVADSYFYGYRMLPKSMGKGYSKSLHEKYLYLEKTIEEVAGDRPYKAKPVLEDNFTMSLLYELKHTYGLNAAERKKIQKELIGQLHDPKRRYRLLLYEDFPGKEMIVNFYHKLRDLNR